MASRSVNKVILLGHLGKDAETKFTPSGVSRSNFTVATNRRWKDQQSGEWKEETDWHNCVLWRSENLSNYLLKGKQVYLEGRLQTRSYEDKDGQKKYFTEVVVDELILLGGRGDTADGAGGLPASSRRRFPCRAPLPVLKPPPAEPPDDLNQGITDDDVPFLAGGLPVSSVVRLAFPWTELGGVPAGSLPQLLECGNCLIQAVQFLVEKGQHFHEIHIWA